MLLVFYSFINFFVAETHLCVGRLLCNFYTLNIHYNFHALPRILLQTKFHIYAGFNFQLFFMDTFLSICCWFDQLQSFSVFPQVPHSIAFSNLKCKMQNMLLYKCTCEWWLWKNALTEIDVQTYFLAENRVERLVL